MKKITNLSILKDQQAKQIAAKIVNSYDELLYNDFACLLFSRDTNLIEKFIKSFDVSNEIIRKAFTHHAFTFVSNNSNNQVLQYLINNGYISYEELSLVSSGNDSNLMHDAAYCGSHSIVKTLLNNNINPNAVNNWGITPLLYATDAKELKTINLLLSNMDEQSISHVTNDGYSFFDKIKGLGDKKLFNSVKSHESLKDIYWKDQNVNNIKFTYSKPNKTVDLHTQHLNMGISFLYKLAFSDRTEGKNHFRKAVLNFSKLKEIISENTINGTEENTINSVLCSKYISALITISHMYYETNTSSPYHAKNIFSQMIEVIQKVLNTPKHKLPLCNEFFVIAQNNNDFDFTNYLMEQGAIYVNSGEIDNYSIHLSNFYYNNGENLQLLGNSKEALKSYYKSHAIQPQDEEIVFAISKLELTNRNYNKMLAITESIQDDTLKKMLEFFNKARSCTEDFNALLELYDYANYSTWAASRSEDFIYLDLSNYIERKLGNSCTVIENLERLLKTCKTPNDKNETLVRIFNELYFAQDDSLKIKIASKYEKDCLENEAFFMYGLYIQQISCIIFINNGYYNEASALLEKHQDLDLHSIYKLVLVTAMSNYDLDSAQQHIDFFRNITTDSELLEKISNDSIILEKYLNPINTQDSSKTIEQHNIPKYDYELYDNSELTSEIDFTGYSTTGIHKYYKDQKNFLNKKLIIQTSYQENVQDSEKWHMKQHYHSNDSTVTQLSSNYYATIDLNLLDDLDSLRAKQFSTALTKGYCTKALGQNGVKSFLGKLFELKINAGDRLYTSEIIINKHGKKLIVFDKHCKSHAQMQTKIQNAKMKYSPELDYDYSSDHDFDNNEDYIVVLSGDDVYET